MANDLNIGVAFPGEMLAIKVIDLVLELSRGQSAAQKKKMWDWVIADIERWRKFWGVDDAAAAKAFSEFFTDAMNAVKPKEPSP